MNKSSHNLIYSIVIPTIAKNAQIESTLSALIASIEDYLLYEILVVDNRDDTNQKSGIDLNSICHSISGNIKVIREPKPGLTAARHAGVKHSTGDVISFIDDDVLVNNYWFKELIVTFADEGCVMAGGPSVPKFNSRVPYWLKNMYSDAPENGRMCHWLTLIDTAFDHDNFNPLYIWGLNLSIRKDVLLRAKGFNPDLYPKHLSHFQGNGETGLALRLIDLGHLARYRQGLCVTHVIDQDRLTYRYFMERSYFQGIADSYQLTRAKSMHEHIPSDQRFAYRFNSFAYPFSLFFKKLLSVIVTPRTSCFIPSFIIKFGMYCELNIGYNFHQNKLKDDVSLLQWINKSNYFD